MNRLFAVCGVALLIAASTGCLHHQTRGGCGGTCNTCPPAGGCESCGGCAEPVGVFGRLRGGACGATACGNGACGNGACGGGSCLGGGACGGGCRPGCVAGPLGWQQGGVNYSGHLQPGLLGHGAGARLNQTPFTPGPPTAQTAYPYYTVRGPRDFFVDNPPTIGR